MKKCFVVSPIGQEGSEVRKRADQVFKYIISPVCEEAGFEAIRVDKVNQADSITQTIIDYLQILLDIIQMLFMKWAIEPRREDR